MVYINISQYGVVETIDEFETRKEGLLMLKEYRMVNADYYLSSRCTKDWRER